MSAITKERQLEDLISVGPAMLRDFNLLGVRSVKELARRNPQMMYSQLNRLKGQTQDICCLDVFRAAVAQAKDPLLSPEKSKWWYWSRLRKEKNGEE
jgi:hypothetical protein